MKSNEGAGMHTTALNRKWQADSKRVIHRPSDLDCKMRTCECDAESGAWWRRFGRHSHISCTEVLLFQASRAQRIASSSRTL